MAEVAVAAGVVVEMPVVFGVDGFAAAGASGFACSDDWCDCCAAALVVVAPAAAAGRSWWFAASDVAHWGAARRFDFFVRRASSTPPSGGRPPEYPTHRERPNVPRTRSHGGRPPVSAQAAVEERLEVAPFDCRLTVTDEAGQTRRQYRSRRAYHPGLLAHQQQAQPSSCICLHGSSGEKR